ncbi:Galactose/methyl galactoside import ATP-binding protein MglA [Devosia equisanguinis]|uniref:Galactose/methyl galactoside import ATP-binding protein MglA n=1 Tax=Devosia equisanguinis TaxID=2490941 RepID=A0A447IC71_9HYPH|nr:sugar ABC transporter ATP-binding protein [Devosia equisanguinis]VDS05069.1 Galactose/methyl galactoside import ATP-binding protein MglA [Devosia equisanguinis]
MTPEIALELEGVTKRYGHVTALNNASFRLRRHSVLGLVGENGAGKSTIIAMINGTRAPSEGRLLVNGSERKFASAADAAALGIATVFQEQGLVPDLRVYQNILLGREKRFSRLGVLDAKGMAAFVSKVFAELGLDIDPKARTGDLSFGQRQLVEIAKAFSLGHLYPVEPIVLLDEPTSALSDAETEVLFNSIRRWKSRASILFVSHHLSDVFEVCDDVVTLKDGSVSGQWPVVETDADRIHEAIVGRPKLAGYYKESAQRDQPGAPVVELRGIHLPGALEAIDLTLHAGEIVGVAGVMGSGKTELAGVLSGALRPSQGQVLLDGAPLPLGRQAQAVRRGIGTVPAERNLAGVIGVHSVEWNMALPSLQRLRHGRSPVLSAARSARMADGWIERLRIRVAGRHVQILNLSGGNAQKVVFAKWMERGIRVFVLDDPGRGLDVGAKEDIYQLLRELAAEGVAILLVSDNLPELIGLSNRIVTLRAGRITDTIAAPAHAKPEEAAVVRGMV